MPQANISFNKIAVIVLVLSSRAALQVHLPFAVAPGLLCALVGFLACIGLFSILGL